MKTNKVKLYGRAKPYTSIGIKRLKCLRCGLQAEHQWSICANKNRHVPICQRCDFELNEFVLKFMNCDYKNTKKLMSQYLKEQNQ